MGQAIRRVLNQLIDELSAKARKYEESEKRIREMAKVRVEN